MARTQPIPLREAARRSPPPLGSGGDDPERRVAVIGAGPSGLVAIRRLRELGHGVDCFEREPDLGGNWNIALATSGVCESTHLISSKRLTEIPEHPMPRDWPEFPSHRQALLYLRSYAERFGLTGSIRFGAAVRRATPLPGGGWEIELACGERLRRRALVVASGHNWDPRLPDYPGRLDGLTLHAHEYKSPEALAGKRVLVVGGGNSGCDIAVDAARNAAVARISLRRGYHFLPKFFHGTPIDIVGERLLRWRTPLAVRRALARAMVLLLLGPRGGVGLPRPDHRLFETHPTINSQLIYELRHGRLAVRPDVERLAGPRVRFVDGTEEEFDVVVYATGYRLTVPFLPPECLAWEGPRKPERRKAYRGDAGLFLNIFAPQREDLFFLGLIQPDSGQWGLVDLQARLVAGYLEAVGARPAAAERFRAGWGARWRRGGVRYLDTPRHLLEVEHYSYRRTLERHIRRLERGRRGRGRVRGHSSTALSREAP